MDAVGSGYVSNPVVSGSTTGRSLEESVIYISIFIAIAGVILFGVYFTLHCYYAYKTDYPNTPQQNIKAKPLVAQQKAQSKKVVPDAEVQLKKIPTKEEGNTSLDSNQETQQGELPTVNDEQNTTTTPLIHQSSEITCE